MIHSDLELGCPTLASALSRNKCELSFNSLSFKQAFLKTVVNCPPLHHGPSHSMARCYSCYSDNWFTPIDDQKFCILCFLRFPFQRQEFQFKVLDFKLSLPIWVLSRCMQVALLPLIARGIGYCFIWMADSMCPQQIICLLGHVYSPCIYHGAQSDSVPKKAFPRIKAKCTMHQLVSFNRFISDLKEHWFWWRSLLMSEWVNEYVCPC